jgi:hypothetical protein
LENKEPKHFNLVLQQWFFNSWKRYFSCVFAVVTC